MTVAEETMVSLARVAWRKRLGNLGQRYISKLRRWKERIIEVFFSRSSLKILKRHSADQPSFKNQLKYFYVKYGVSFESKEILIGSTVFSSHA